MNIQLIFTSSIPKDFVDVVGFCLANGIKPQVSFPERTTPGTVPVPGESPIVAAFRAANIGRLRVQAGETPEQAATRRLIEAGLPVPESSQNGDGDTAPPVSMENLDGEDL